MLVFMRISWPGPAGYGPSSPLASPHASQDGRPYVRVPPDWTYEPKWDGFRILASIRDGHVRLISWNGHSFTNLFDPVSDALRGFPASLLLDGEVHNNGMRHCEVERERTGIIEGFALR